MKKMLSLLRTDVAFALRLYRRTPGFTATLLAVLVLGIGATTAMFSLVVSLFVRPLPFDRPDDLTTLWVGNAIDPHSSLSIPDYLDYKARSTSFAALAAIEADGFSLGSDLGGGKTAEALPGAAVSGEFFPLLGVAALHGRLLGPEDDRPGAPRVAVLGANLWHRRFGSDPGLIGRSVLLNGQPFTVVGIAAEGFRFSRPSSDRCEVWTAISLTPHWAGAKQSRGDHFLHVVGRRRPGVSVEQAQSELTAIASALEAEHPDTNDGMRVMLADLHSAIVGEARQSVWILFGAIALVFVVMCANVANLLLARSTARRGEMAARAALGATRTRLAVQIVTETLVLFVAAATFGTLLARWLVDVFASGIVRGGARILEVRVDHVALAFALLTALVCGAIAGLVPALQASSVAPQAVLRESAGRASLGRSTRALRGVLVVAQVALAFALLAGSGLALRAFLAAAATPPGFDPEGVATTWVSLPDETYGSNDDQLRAFFRDVVDRIGAAPGVTSVAVSSSLPMGRSFTTSSVTVDGKEPWEAARAKGGVDRNRITNRYFETMRIPLLRGRSFDASDGPGTRRVAILSKTAADTLFPGEDPIGHHISFSRGGDDDVGLEVIGVVGDVRTRGLSREVRMEAYVPYVQDPIRFVAIVARGADPRAILEAMPRIVDEIDSQQATSGSFPMTEVVASSIREPRFVTQLLGAFAAAALLLATLGIFGLVSYTTEQRTRELGIRAALGSSPERIVLLVMGDGARLLAIGLGVGAALAFVVGRAIAGRVLGAQAFDPLVFAVIMGALAPLGLVAALLPAIRAMRIAPALALRAE